MEYKEISFKEYCMIKRPRRSYLVIMPDGSKYWYTNRDLNRNDGPAIIRADNYKAWYQNGRCHRTDGPAIMHADGSVEWLQKDALHREDGPAGIYSNGFSCWYLNGVSYSKEEWFSKLTPEQLAIALANPENF